jgi:two-component system, cell cycle sensor histidine kinase and response regulator CckA
MGMPEDLVADLQGRILGQLPVGLWVARAPAGDVVYVNEALAEILGLPAGATTSPPGPAGGTSAGYAFHDRAGRPLAADRLPIARVLASGQALSVDDLVIHRDDGRRVDVRALAAPVRDAAGAVTHVIVAVLDISAEVRAISERQAIEQRMTFAIDHAPVSLFTLDDQGVLTMSGGAGLRALGYRPGYMVGRSLFDVYRDHPTIPGNIRRALAGETVEDTVFVRDWVLELSMAPMRDARGQVVGVIGATFDVTERRRMQGQTIQNDRIMAMGTLAASVAHEINNPLAYILGSVQAIERALPAAGAAEDPPWAAAIRQGLEGIRTGAERVRDVVRGLRSFTRPDDETVSAVEISAVVRAVLELVRKEIEARARLELDLRETPAVRANEARLVQVVLNLLVNAWQALGTGDPRRHVIGLHTYGQDGGGSRQAVIEVTDSGPGVPPAQRARIFEPFFTTKDVGEGTGLGLFVCRNIVSAFGGSISVGDRPGGGAVFRVVLPAALVRGRRLTPPVGVHAVPHGRRARVLIVDDDEWVSRTLVQSLRHEFEVVAVNDGERALGLLVADPPFDLAFCDLMMKGITGMDIHERLAERAPQLLPRLVFMTGGAFTPRAAEFVERHAGSVIYKPFDIVAEVKRRLPE